MQSLPRTDGWARVPGMGPRAWLRSTVEAVRRRKRELFWFWIAYQTVKGTATTAIIWLPALAYWLA